jgi:hypothetical protein
VRIYIYHVYKYHIYTHIYTYIHISHIIYIYLYLECLDRHGKSGREEPDLPLRRAVAQQLLQDGLCVGGEEWVWGVGCVVWWEGWVGGMHKGAALAQVPPHTITRHHKTSTTQHSTAQHEREKGKGREGKGRDGTRRDEARHQPTWNSGERSLSASSMMTVWHLLRSATPLLARSKTRPGVPTCVCVCVCVF